MTKQEVAEMLEFANACYPNSQIKDRKKMLDVWSAIFSDISPESAMQGMKAACLSSKWFPSVAEVMAEIKAKNDLMRGYLE